MDTELKKAIQVVCKALREDKDYRYGWQSNIAMPFVDEAQRVFGDDINQNVWHEIANHAANHFLDLFSKDTEFEDKLDDLLNHLDTLYLVDKKMLDATQIRVATEESLRNFADFVKNRS